MRGTRTISSFLRTLSLALGLIVTAQPLRAQSLHAQYSSPTTLPAAPSRMLPSGVASPNVAQAASWPGAPFGMAPPGNSARMPAPQVASAQPPVRLLPPAPISEPPRRLPPSSPAESDWLRRGGGADPSAPQDLPPVRGPRAQPVLFDPTTENRELIAPGRLMPLPPAAGPPVGPKASVGATGPLTTNGAKDGVLQQLAFIKNVMPKFDPNGLGFMDLLVKGMLAFPTTSRESPLLISPGFAAHFLDGPSGSPVPAQLFESWTEIRWLRPIGAKWMFDFGFTPGIYGDYTYINADTWRYQGRGIAIYNWSATMQLIGGLAYLDRDDIKFMPIAGVIWTPNPKWRFEILVPRPKVTNVLSQDGRRTWSTYLAGEFGGNTFSATLPDQTRNVMTYSDLRLYGGFERKSAKGHSFYGEIGWVFNRKLEYRDNGVPSFDPVDTMLLRSGTAY